MDTDHVAGDLLEQTEAIDDVEQRPVDTRYQLASDAESVRGRQQERPDADTWYDRIEDGQVDVEDIRVADEEPRYEMDVEYTVAVKRLLRPDTEIDIEGTITGTLEEGYSERPGA